LGVVGVERSGRQRRAGGGDRGHGLHQVVIFAEIDIDSDR
jgi:hypothetical protein